MINLQRTQIGKDQEKLNIFNFTNLPRFKTGKKLLHFLTLNPNAQHHWADLVAWGGDTTKDFKLKINQTLCIVIFLPCMINLILDSKI